MGGETIRNKADEWKGMAKETVGDLTNNEDLQAEGAVEKAAARAKQAVHHVKDHLEDASDDARDDFGR